MVTGRAVSHVDKSYHSSARLNQVVPDSTEIARSTQNTWDEVGEAFVRELGYSRIMLKLNAADKDSREDVQAIFRTSLGEFLEQCLVRHVD